MCGGPHLGFRSPQATAFFFARAMAIALSFVFSFGQAQSTMSSRHLSLPLAWLFHIAQLLATTPFLYVAHRRPRLIGRLKPEGDLP
jgi:hypothetical protein